MRIVREEPNRSIHHQEICPARVKAPEMSLGARIQDGPGLQANPIGGAIQPERTDLCESLLSRSENDVACASVASASKDRIGIVTGAGEPPAQFQIDVRGSLADRSYMRQSVGHVDEFHMRVVVQHAIESGWWAAITAIAAMGAADAEVVRKRDWAVHENGGFARLILR